MYLAITFISYTLFYNFLRKNTFFLYFHDKEFKIIDQYPLIILPKPALRIRNTLLLIKILLALIENNVFLIEKPAFVYLR